MDPKLIARLEASFDLLAPRGEELVSRFYNRLFSTHPGVRSMFPDEMSAQQQKLLASIALVMANIRTPEKLVEPLHQMGVRHLAYGTQPEHYEVVRDTLVAVMSELAGDAWNEQLTSDWNAALDFVAATMLEGCELSKQRRAA